MPVKMNEQLPSKTLFQQRLTRLFCSFAVLSVYLSQVRSIKKHSSTLIMLSKNPIKKTYLSLFLVAIIGVGLSLMAHQYVKQWEHDNAINALIKEGE
jgi:hypothetical protein